MDAVLRLEAVRRFVEHLEQEQRGAPDEMVSTYAVARHLRTLLEHSIAGRKPETAEEQASLDLASWSAAYRGRVDVVCMVSLLMTEIVLQQIDIGATRSEFVALVGKVWDANAAAVRASAPAAAAARGDRSALEDGEG